MNSLAGFALAPMQVSDLDEVCGIESEQHSHPWTRGNFADALTAGDRAWVCRAPSAELVGYWLVRQVLDEAELLDITVARAWQGRGLGRALLGHLLDLTRQSGAEKIFLEVRRSNLVAQSLYRSHGFVETAVRRNYYPTAHGREDAILMMVGP